MTDCVYVTREQRIGMVAAEVVADYSEPFRLAREGEPTIPVLFDDAECEEHGDRLLTWRRVDPDNLESVERAIEAGCDGLCACRCGHRAARTANEMSSQVEWAKCICVHYGPERADVLGCPIHGDRP